MTTETKIATIFESSPKKEKKLLLIIDIDDFKEVNDNLGHHIGDLVLREVGSNLKLHCGNQDIIGRIGGDEFLVLIKDISDVQAIIKKANDITASFLKTCFEENSDYIISISIGIARYPLDGNNYIKQQIKHSMNRKDEAKTPIPFILIII